ncbi:MAG: nucleotidyltransferase [Proteobacteria bacterium]|nr:nucleotidyltransferase [Pseudomonadota bacterium]
MPTLVILAAGLGARYGGLKQLDPIGPGDQSILEYSVYDALRSGFDDLVFVIRRDMEKDCRELARRFPEKGPVRLVFQELDLLPAGISVPAGRTKPWGTGHAVWACHEAVARPFCVINADDFYGREAFSVMADFLGQVDPGESRFAMVGFSLENTLSEHGAVSRGICRVSLDGFLVSVTERTSIERAGASIRFQDGDGWGNLTGGEPVSLNFWGFTPSLFPRLEQEFALFMAQRGRDAAAEFFLPTVVDKMVAQGQATVRVLDSPDQWVGVTFRQDRDRAKARLEELTASGDYPRELWERKG